MKPLLLTPDMNDTDDFDVILGHLNFELEVATHVAEKHPDNGFNLVAAAERAIKDYKESNAAPAVIKIGYMPSAKRTELEHRHSSVVGKYQGQDNPSYSVEDAESLTDIVRETCAWSVKGHAIEGAEFTTKTVDYRGKKYKLASDDVVDLYERNDWLHLIRREAVVFNRLGPEKKRQSSLQSGTDRTI